jgi:hypothetical protein
MPKLVQNEPVLTALTVFVAAVFAVLAAFGVDVTDDQVKALIGLTVAAYVLAAVVRSKVTPVKRPRR